jgi:hypothetical protein
MSGAVQDERPAGHGGGSAVRLVLCSVLFWNALPVFFASQRLFFFDVRLVRRYNSRAITEIDSFFRKPEKSLFRKHARLSISGVA